jgi:hypothetical protein
MSQLVDITITNRGANLDLLPGGPTLYGFDVKDIVSPIRYNSGLSKSYFTARTNKGGVNDNHNGSKIDYQSSDSLAVITAKSPLFLLLNVVSRRGVDGGGEAYIFVSSKITESLVPTPDGTLFYYIEDGDPLPVEYVVSQTIPQIIAQSTSGIAIQDDGTDMPPQPKLNFVGYTVEDNPGNNSTDIVNVKDITWASLKALKTANNLPVGAWYRITDRYNYQSNGAVGIPNLIFLGDDRGYVYIKAITPNSFSKEVIRVMAVPANYSTTGTLKGVWDVGKTANINDTMIWGCKVWKNITGNIGTAISDSVLSADWQLQTKALNTGAVYVDKQFTAIYDFDTDWFELQRDNRGNEFGCPSDSLALYNPSNVNHCDFTDWNFHSDTGVQPSFFNIKAISFLNNQQCIASNSIIRGVILKNKLSDINGNDYNGALEEVDFNYSFLNNELQNGISPLSIDITGLTTLSLISIPLGQTDTKAVKEVILTSSNATESINLFDATVFSGTDPKHKIKFKPDVGLTVTFVSNLGGGPYVPVCEGGVNAVLDGANGDWIEFQKGPLGIIQTNIGTY